MFGVAFRHPEWTSFRSFLNNRLSSSCDSFSSEGVFNMRRFATLTISGFIAVYLQACSVVQATSGPSAKDLSVLDTGTNRFSVLAELGKPVATETDNDGNKIDVFSFRQGQHGAVKAGKGLLYGALAVGTLGVSEIVTSPLEGAAGNGAHMKVQVHYDSDNKVSTVNTLKDGRWIPIQAIAGE